MSWKRVLIGDIAIEDRCIVLPDSDEAVERPYLGLEQIESNTGQILSYDLPSAEGKSTTFAFDETHVLYGKLRPYLNKVALPDRKGRCSTEIIPLKPIGVDRHLLAVLLRTEKVINAVMSEKTGSRMPRADMDILLGIEVSIPESENEQARIAVRLEAQSVEVETARQAALSQLQDTGILRTRVLAGIFNRLDFVETKVLGDYAATTSGSTPSRGIKLYWQPAEIPWVKTGEVNFSTINATEEAISKIALAECSLTLLPPQSVLVAMYGQGKTRGQSAILEIEATTNQACFAVLPNETWEPDFLYFWFMASYQDLRSLSENRGGNQANLNGALLNALKIPAPDKEVQKSIVQQVKAALSEIETMERTSKTMLADIEQIPNRILAQAFES
jgi:type I restriction enzyme S subunit